MPAARTVAAEAAPPRGISELEARDAVLLHAGHVVDVWRAVLPDGRTAVLKTANPRYKGHAGAAALLRREYRALAALRHPSIVTPLAWMAPAESAADGPDDEADSGILVLEYLPCGDLVPLAGTEARHWIAAVLDVVDALDHVHASGFVHSDVKARNVLFSSARRAKLVDFGSAVAIGEPLPRGGRTAAHAPRDRALASRLAADGTPAAPALDVHALAVLVFELLVGRLPFGTGRSGQAAAGGRGAQDAAVGAVLRAADAAGAGAAGRALAARVGRTLAATSLAEVGTLTAFRDVLESVRSRTA